MPLTTVRVADLDSSIFTQTHRPIRKLENHICKIPPIPIFYFFETHFRDLYNAPHPAYDVCGLLVSSLLINLWLWTCERETHAAILRLH